MRACVTPSCIQKCALAAICTNVGSWRPNHVFAGTLWISPLTVTMLLSRLRSLIAEVDGPNDVIQVDGIKGVGVPIGSPDFVQQFVATKASEIIRDVETVQVGTDPLLHFHLLSPLLPEHSSGIPKSKCAS